MDEAKPREFKDRLFEQFARIGKALSSPKRLEIVDLLAQGERNVEEIARETSVPVASASQHLQVVKSARMVESRREGLYAHYRLAGEEVFEVWRAVRELGEREPAGGDRAGSRVVLEGQEVARGRARAGAHGAPLGWRRGGLGRAPRGGVPGRAHPRRR